MRYQLATAFAWRHKILDALQSMMTDVELDGVVQADETFTAVSYKGNHKSFNRHVQPTREELRRVSVAYQQKRFVFLVPI